ncbi:hypothetical protein QJS10_CPA08g00104 [Acorus calamus]|uniref:ENT domain-containing protein n=1 Tax=Acorus calamus TaxID=4465 RepID=A0AAV9EBG6_ACOCL|nr:hypothetical protein QJS10_CPA08g00104 [Acorus calamus]
MHLSRTVVIPSVEMLCEMDFSDMGCQIHDMEIEAYGALLKAFIAQSDVLSWDKEELISELRKELNVSDVEHREILGRVNLDDTIKMIREWRKQPNGQQQLPHNRVTTSSFPSVSLTHIPRKKMKSAPITISSSSKCLPCTQLSKVGGSPSLPTQYRDELQFSEANPGQIVKAVLPKKQTSDYSKGRVSTHNGFLHTAVDGFKPGWDKFEICATDKLIHEINRRIFGKENPNPVQIEKARALLKEQESALLEAIRKLSDVPSATFRNDDEINGC